MHFAVTARACRLGVHIGMEWTRPKDVRRISTQDLRMLHAQLEQAPDVSVGLAQVEATVNAKTGR